MQSTQINASKCPQSSGTLANNAPSVITSAEVAEEDCDIAEIDIPPPMKIQEHSYQTIMSTPKDSLQDSSSDTVSIALPWSPSDSSLIHLCQLGDIVHNLTLDDKDVSTCEQNDDKPEEESQESEKDRALAKRKYVLQELIETEKDYVNNLGIIVDGYVNLLRSETSDTPIPEDLKNGKEKIIFGNIEAIYDWHKEFVLSSMCHSVP